MKASALHSRKDGIYRGQQLPTMWQVMPKDVAVGGLSLLHWLSPGISSPPGPAAEGQSEWQPRDRETQCVKWREGLMTRAEVKAAWNKQGLKLARAWGQIHISKVE